MSDRPDSVPRYQWVADQLRERIQNREWLPGDRMPTEAELSRQYDVHRLTIRQAITQLRVIGLVDARQGSGTYVAGPTSLLELTINPKDEQDSGSSIPDPNIPSMHTVRERFVDVVEGTDRVAAAYLKTEPDRLLGISTILESDSLCYALSTYWLDRERLGAVIDGWRDGQTMGARLSECFGITAYYDWRRFRATGATPEVAAGLAVPIGSAILVRDGVSQDQYGVAVYYVLRQMRGDRVAYTMSYPERS